MFFNLFDYIYVINLPHRSDRKREIVDQLISAGIDVHDSNLIFFAANRPEDKGEFDSIGARGCFLSHLGVMKMAISHNAKRFLILEDDCNFSPGIQEQLELSHGYLQTEEWALFYGGTLAVSGLRDGPTPGLKLVPPPEGLLGSHCIGVQGQVAADIVAYMEAMLHRPGGHPDGGPMHVDGAYSWFRRAHGGLITVLAVPEVAYQRSSRTDIGQTRWFDRIPLLSMGITLIRRFKDRFRFL